MNQTDNSYNDDETIEQYLCNSNDENETKNETKTHDNLKKFLQMKILKEF